MRLNTSIPENASLRVARELDRVCDSFEAAWLSGQAPRLEAVIADSEVVRKDELFQSLLPIEIFHRLRRGEFPKVAEYSERFPHCDASWLQSVLEREVASLARHAAMHPSTDSQGSSVTSLSRTETASSLANRELPGYEILAELGRGGMGIVYQARQTQLGRLVAIKMISAGDSALAADIARFRREAETIAQLNDPHIVQLFEVGLTHGKPYLVMEFVPGLSLSQMIQQALPPPRVAAQLLTVLARSMHEVHRRNIVHRDLKPANVLIAAGSVGSPTDGQYWLGTLKPKITDFGLAKSTMESQGLTMSGGVLGTPSYMSPEQARGDAQIGAAADIYGLGAIFYELLTGRPPFKSFQVASTIRQVLEQEPMPPRHLQTHIPADLNTICLKCLEKMPQRRYLSALDLADDLERFLRHEPIRARAVSPLMRAVRWCQRHPARATAAILGVVAAISLGLVSFAYLFALSQARSAAAMRAEQQKTAEALEQVSELKKEAESLSASLAINQGQALCDNSNASRGLLWFARGMELLRDERSSLAIATRKNIGAWRKEIHALKQIRTLPREAMAMAMNKANDRVAIVGIDRQVHLFDTREGNPIGAPLELPQVGTAVAFSDDGELLACGTLVGTIVVWNLSDNSQIRSWVGHAEQIYDLAFTSADRRLISAGRDSVVHSWDPKEGNWNGQPLVHSGPVVCLAVSADGRHLLTGSIDGFIRRWNLETSKLASEPVSHPSGVLALAFSHDDRSYALGRLDGVAQIFDSASNMPRGKPLEHRARIRSIEFSADDRWVLTSSRDATARLWDVATSRPLGAAVEHRDELCTALLTRDQKTILTASEDRTLRLWQVAQSCEPSGTSQPLVASAPMPRSEPAWTSRRFFGMRWRHQDAQLIGFSPSGLLAYGVAAGGLELAKARAIQLYDSVTGNKIGEPLMHDGALMDVAFSPDESKFATVTKKGSAYLWKVSVDHPEPVQVLSRGGVKSVAFHPRNGILATVGRRGVEFWNCSDASKAMGTMSAKELECALFDPSGDRLAAVHASGEITIVDTRNGTATHSIPSDGAGDFSSAAFSNDGELLVVSNWNGGVRIWRLNDPQGKLVSFEHHEPVWGVQFSPDGHIVAAATAAGNVYSWDSRTGEAVTTPFQLREYVNDLTFSPDGRTLLLAGQENKLRLVDVLTGLPIGPILWTPATSQHVHFIGAGEYFASGDQTPLLHMYQNPVPQTGSTDDMKSELEHLCGLRLGQDGVIRCLSAEEWNSIHRVSKR